MDPAPIMRAHLGDGTIILRRNGRTEILDAAIVEGRDPVHVGVTKTGRRTRIYLNGIRIRRPRWFWLPIDRARERRRARRAYGAAIGAGETRPVPLPPADDDDVVGEVFSIEDWRSLGLSRRERYRQAEGTVWCATCPWKTPLPVSEHETLRLAREHATDTGHVVVLEQRVTRQLVLERAD